MSKADLAIHLLDTIVRDNLYDAIIDRDIEHKKRTAVPPKTRPS